MKNYGLKNYIGFLISCNIKTLQRFLTGTKVSVGSTNSPAFPKRAEDYCGALSAICNKIHSNKIFIRNDTHITDVCL